MVGSGGKNVRVLYILNFYGSAKTKKSPRNLRFRTYISCMNAALVIVKLLTERAKAMLKSVGPSSPVSRGGNWQPGTHSEAGQTSEDAVPSES